MYVPSQVRLLQSVTTAAPFNVNDDDQRELAQASQAFHRQVANVYKLDLRLLDSLDKPSKLKLDVTDISGRRQRNLQVIYPDQLARCR